MAHEKVTIENLDWAGGVLRVTIEDLGGSGQEPPNPEPPPPIRWRFTATTAAETQPYVDIECVLDAVHAYAPIRATMSLGAAPGVDPLTPGEDFVWTSPLEVVIPAGEVSGFFRLYLTDDPDVENDETYPFILSAVEDDVQAGFADGTEQTLDVPDSVFTLTVTSEDVPLSLSWSTSSIDLYEDTIDTSVKVILEQGRSVTTAYTVSQVSGPDLSTATGNGRFDFVAAPALILASGTTDRIEEDYDLTGIDTSPTEEGLQTIVLRLASVDTGIAVGPISDLTINVYDYPQPAAPPDIGWDLATHDALEGQQLAMVYRLTGPTEVPITVTLGTGAGTADQGTDWLVLDGPNGSDRGAGPTWEFTIPANGDEFGIVYLEIVDDTDTEGIETRVFTLAAVEAVGQDDPVGGGTFSPQALVASPANTTVSIAASDPVTSEIGWEGPLEFSMLETETVTRRINLSGQTLPLVDVVVDIARSGVNVADRISWPSQATIRRSGGFTETFVDVDFVGLGNNEVTDGDELASFTISTGTVGVNVATGFEALDVTVQDPASQIPLADIGFLNPTLSRIESTTAQISLAYRFYEPGTDTVVQSGPGNGVGRPVTVTITATGGSATRGDAAGTGDWYWQSAPFDVDFQTEDRSAGNIGGQINIELNDDADFEGNETIVFSIEAVEREAQPGYSVQTCDLTAGRETMTVTIEEDEEQRFVNFDQQNTLISEGQTISTGQPALQVVLSAAVPAGETVTMDIVQTNPAVDVGGRLAWTESLVFAAGEATQTVVLTATDNDVDGELAQDVTLAIQNIVSAVGYIAGAGATTTVTVQDDPGVEQPQYGFQFVQFDCAEPGSASPLPSDVRLNVNIENWAAVPQNVSRTVAVEQIGGSGTFGSDLGIEQPGDVESSLLEFGPGQSSKQIKLKVLPDNAVEDAPEDILLGLTPIASSDGNQTLGVFDGQPLVVNIMASAEVSGSAPLSAYTFQMEYPSDVLLNGEGDVFYVTVVANGPVPQECTVILRHYSPNAIGGDDGDTPQPDWSLSTGDAPEGFIRATFQPGERRAATEFKVNAAGFADRSKFVVFELVATQFGMVGDTDRMIVHMRGDTDAAKAVPDEPPIPGGVDFRVYTDRVEQLDPVTGATLGTFATSNRPNDNAFTWLTAQTQNAPTQTADYNIRYLWQQRNPGGVDWMDEGVPVVIEVMEDCFFNARIGDGNSGLAYRVRDESGGFIQNFFAIPVRDLWIIGNGGGIGTQVTMSNTTFYMLDQGGGPSSGPIPTPCDQVHFQNIGIRNRLEDPLNPGAYRSDEQTIRSVVTRRGSSPFWFGLIRLNNCLIGNTDESYNGTITAVAPGLNNFSMPKMNIRFIQRANWWITDCTFRPAREHSAYVDAPPGMFIFARNDTPHGTGRTQVQIVQRPFDYGQEGPCSNGLLAIVDNNVNDMGPPWGSGARAWSIYGWWGHIVFNGNTSTGRLRGDNGESNTRGNLALLHEIYNNVGYATGNYITEYPPLSGNYYSHGRVEIDDFTFDTTDANGDGWDSGSLFPLNGAYEIVIGDFDIQSTHIGSTPFFEFNINAAIDRAPRDLRPILDQIGRRVYGRQYVWNRTDGNGVSWKGPAAGPTQGSILAYGGWGAATRKASHRAINTPYPPNDDSGLVYFDEAGTGSDINTYDGTDPTPGV